MFEPEYTELKSKILTTMNLIKKHIVRKASQEIRKLRKKWASVKNLIG